MLSGGIIGTLLDCHCNWAGAYHLMKRAGLDSPPCTVTADYAIKLLRPTPTDQPIELKARVIESTDDRAIVEGELIAHGKSARLAGELSLPSNLAIRLIIVGEWHRLQSVFLPSPEITD